MPDFGKLKQHIDRLSSLLYDPHPGTLTWSQAVAKSWKAISDMWVDDEHQNKFDLLAGAAYDEDRPSSSKLSSLLHDSQFSDYEDYH